MINLDELDEQEFEVLTEVVIENCIFILDLPYGCKAVEDLSENQDLAWHTVEKHVKDDIRSKFFELFKRREMMKKISKALQMGGAK